MARTAYLVIHESTIQSYLLPGGEVKEDIDRVLKYSTVVSARIVGKRTGKLAANMRYNKLKVSGPLVGTGMVYNPVRHSRWVNNGTEGPIFPKNGKYLAVPHIAPSYNGIKGGDLRAAHRAGGPKEYSLRVAVSGQKPQRFLERGLRESLRTNGY